MAGQGQVKPDTITINFQLSSKVQGEKATVVYPDFMTFDTSVLHPVTDSEGRWTVQIPTYRPLHIQMWDDNKIQGVVWGALNLYCRPGTVADILFLCTHRFMSRTITALIRSALHIPTYRVAM